MPISAEKKELNRLPNLIFRPIAFAVAIAFGNGVLSLPASACSTVVTSIDDGLVPADLDSILSSAVTLRAAVKCADIDPAQNIVTFQLPINSVIQLDPYTFPEYIDVSSDVTITGPAPNDNDSVIIQAGDDRIFYSSASLTLENMTLRNGVAPTGEGGGAIYINGFNTNNGQLVLNHTLLTNNQTTLEGGNGGAIYSGVPITLNNSTITNNDAPNGKGGGIYTYFDVTLNNSIISNNSTSGDGNSGGGISIGSDALYAKITLNNSTLSGNYTTGNFSSGGGIQTPKEVIITDSVIHNNKTEGNNSSGGGVFTGGPITITRSTITANKTEGLSSKGGGIFIGSDDTPSEIFQSSISGNSTHGNDTVQLTNSAGGGIHSERSHLNIYNSTLADNYTVGARGDGGAIKATSLKLVQSTISGNEVRSGSSSGGGINIVGSTNEQATEIIQSTITDNSHGSDGTAGVSIRTDEFDVRIVNSILSGNMTNADGDLNFITTNNKKMNIYSSLLGTSLSTLDFSGDVGINSNNIFGIDASYYLNFLSNNGGTTLTHLPNTSVASNIIIDNGDKTLTPDLLNDLDQRRTGFDRVLGSDVDIGSTESPPSIEPAACFPS